MTEAYPQLLFLHVLLFAYWLGADLGVFLAGGAMSRPGLAVPERNRIRALLMDIDLAPRLAFIAMVPVGLTLALSWGAPVPAGWLPWVWLAAGAWLATAVALHVAHGGAWSGRLIQVDRLLRVLLLAGVLLLAARHAPGGSAPLPRWLWLKLLIVAGVILDGYLLNRFSGQWRLAMDRFAAGDVAGGEALLRVRRLKAASAALVMWSMVATAAWLGVVKPA